MSANFESLKNALLGDGEVLMEANKIRLDGMSLEEKIRLCSKLSRQGIANKELARFFSVSTRTIYDWLRRDLQSLREEMEAKPAIELIIEQMADLEAYEKLCMYEASHLGRDQIEIDPETGEKRLVEGKENVRVLDQKTKLIQLAISIRKMRIDLYSQTGIIPKQPDKLYVGVGEYRNDPEQEDMQKFNRSPEELKQSVMDKLFQQTSLQ